MELELTETERMGVGVSSERISRRAKLTPEIQETADWYADVLWDNKEVEINDEQREHLVEICKWGREDTEYENALNDVLERIEDTE